MEFSATYGDQNEATQQEGAVTEDRKAIAEA